MHFLGAVDFLVGDLMSGFCAHSCIVASAYGVYLCGYLCHGPRARGLKNYVQDLNCFL